MADNHNQLLKDLIETISKDDITSETIKQIEKSNLWKELLEFMKQEGGSNLLGHYPIFQSDFKNNTLFKFINAAVDMDSNESPSGSFNFKTILNNLKNKVNPDGSANTDGNNPWNESLTNSLTYLLRYIDPEYVRDYENEHKIDYKPGKDKETNLSKEVNNTNGSIPVTGGSLNGGFRVTDVKNADAGNSFTNDGKKSWVVPNYNVDGDTYDKVRGIDKILQALTNNKEMQFTRTQNSVSKYIRLLMPKYLRRVEVEDLNRNFWVIGQVLAAISAYLFDEDSPIVNTFSKILNELVQLWENILYLWASIALINKKQYYTNVHTEVVYVPNSMFNDYFKYDDFDNIAPNNLSECWTRLSYLKEQYPQSNLCIIPVVRKGNYEKNYYDTEVYYGIILYDRNSDEVKYITFNTNGLNIKAQSYGANLFGLREENDQYIIKAPFNSINALEERKVNKYYCLLRTNASATVSYTNGVFNVQSVVIQGIDAVDRILQAYDQTRTLGGPVLQYQGQLESGKTNITLLNTISNPPTPSGGYQINIKNGYYQGELISTWARNKELVPIKDIVKKSILLSDLSYTIENRKDYTGSYEELKEKIIEDQSKLTKQSNRIYIGRHRINPEDGKYRHMWFPLIIIYNPNELQEDKKYTKIDIDLVYSYPETGVYKLQLLKNASNKYESIKFTEDGEVVTLPKMVEIEGHEDHTDLIEATEKRCYTYYKINGGEVADYSGPTGVSAAFHSYTIIDGEYIDDGVKITKLIIYFYDQRKFEAYKQYYTTVSNNKEFKNIDKQVTVTLIENNLGVHKYVCDVDTLTTSNVIWCEKELYKKRGDDLNDNYIQRNP